MKPPRLVILAIKAKPPAAAVPPRKIGGTVQKVARHAIAPDAASEKPLITPTSVRAIAATPKPAADSSADNKTCNTGLPLRSDDQPNPHVTAIATAYGIITIQPLCALS